MAGMTQEQRLFFETNGYLVIENALSPEELKQAQKAADRAEAVWQADTTRPGPRKHPGAWVQAIMEYDDLLFNMIEHPRTFPIVREIVGPDIAMIDHDCVRTTAGSGFKTRWHHDVSLPRIFHPFSVLMVKIFFLLSDVAEEDGPTLFLPGSHRYPMDMPLPHVEVPEDMPGHVKMAYPAGTAYIFNGRTYHCAGVQRGSKDRRVLMYNYGHKWMKMWQGYEPSPHLQSRAQTPIRRQLLGMADPYGENAE